MHFVGKAKAKVHLGTCYQHGIGVVKDIKRAFELYKQAAAQGDAYAQNELGECYSQGIGVAQALKQAAEFFSQAAAQGLDIAQNNLGACYRCGDGVTKDHTLAFQMYELAADQGLDEAQNNLGSCYLQGHGVTKNDKRAFQMFELAAAQGLPIAQRNLADCYDKGTGVAKDANRAAKLYQLAATQGDAHAQYSLGICYQHEIGVSKDDKRAIELYEQAAAQGLPIAQCKLGHLYYNGIAVRKDVKRGIELFEQAAALGCAHAQYNLGYCYVNGSGLIDEQRATILFQASARQGNTQAINILNARVADSNTFPFPNLDIAIMHYKELFSKHNDISALTTVAFCYQMGLMVKQDLEQAIELYQRAIKMGASCERDLLKCYQSQVQQGHSATELIGFYEILKKSAEGDSDKKGNCEHAYILAYLYEKGAPGLEQNLFESLKYYTLSNSDADSTHFYSNERSYVLSKLFQYQNLHKLKNAVITATENNPLNDDIASIISEYAYESNTTFLIKQPLS